MSKETATLKKAKYFIKNNLVKKTLSINGRHYFDVGHIKDVIVYDDLKVNCPCKRGTLDVNSICSHGKAVIMYLKR